MNAVAYLIKQAGELQRESHCSMGNEYMKRAYLPANHGPRGLREYLKQYVS